MNAGTVEQKLAEAVELHRAGRLSEAENLYRRILAEQPQHADALHLLGVIANQVGRFDVGADLIGKAIERNSSNAAYFLNLGIASNALGQKEIAIEAYRTAVLLRPDDTDACNNLGVLLTESGHFGQAVEALGTAVRLRPDHAEYYYNFGNALRCAGQVDRAISAYRAALAHNPRHADAHNNLGNVYDSRGESEQAISAFRAAIDARPDHAVAYNNLGRLLTHRGELSEAVSALRKAVSLQPNYAVAYNNLGIALQVQSHLDQALEAFEKAIALDPDNVETHCNLGVAFLDGFQPDKAIEAFHRALRIDHNSVVAYEYLGFALKEQGRMTEAFEAYRHAVGLNPHSPSILSKLVYPLLFHFDGGEPEIEEAHRAWDRRFGEPHRRNVQPHSNDRTASRRLRIGYVSPNFSGHVISHFLVPLLEQHDHSQFEIYAYAGVKRPDAVTERMKLSVDVWRSVLGMDDEAVARQIREDRIDILIDLTQHMAENRLPVFARKPAPIQVAWLGYPGTTGLRAMDYRITDGMMEPEGSPWSESVEKPIRLPDSWFCFDPLNRYPDVGTLPALRNGYLTFGCLNNFCKVNEAVLGRWARILQALPKSKLLLQCPTGLAQENVGRFFQSCGIDAARVKLVSKMKSRAEFLDLFQQMDVTLDPFPYNGGTTTCESLWMGIPVLTLPGQSALSRIGLSILRASNMPEFVASTEENYIELARQPADDLPRLATIRLELRERMLQSPFMNYSRFTRDMESAYRKMWTAWCEG